LLITSDLADGDNLKIECRVNGETRQSSNTSDMVFNCRQLVAYASRYFTLKPGDTIVTSIEKLGELEFKLT
jgi:2-keto-4-pentenoate hydratase/2-oxohepta-3-ene-1,7-dioic acid hydratase in catechol pathway